MRAHLARLAIGFVLAFSAFLAWNVVLPYNSARAGWQCVQSFGQGGYDAVTLDPIDHHEIYTWVEESNLQLQPGEMSTDRERQLLAQRDRILDRLAQLDQERRELQDRLTLIDLELGI